MTFKSICGGDVVGADIWVETAAATAVADGRYRAFCS